MYSEDDLLPLSALQHLYFCERQCALIHVEQVWLENRFTAEGRIMHERVDTGKSEMRGGVRTSFAVSLRSLRLGLVGKADVVEFHRRQSPDGRSAWQPFPVEYKRGRPKKDNCDKIQLCAQALCLEEMLNLRIECGALFYGKTRRRQDVPEGIVGFHGGQDAVAIHLGHDHIEEHQVELAEPEFVEGLAPVLGEDDSESLPAQAPGKESAVGLVVIDDEERGGLGGFIVLAVEVRRIGFRGRDEAGGGGQISGAFPDPGEQGRGAIAQFAGGAGDPQEIVPE